MLTVVENAWSGCKRCELSRTRRKVVFWRGNPSAPLVIIGEAPGQEEDIDGRPFVGPAGRLLDAAIRSAGLDPAEDVWIGNTLGCRPPGNRRPAPEELAACRGRLYDMTSALSIGERSFFVLLLGATAGKLAGVSAVQSWRRERLEAIIRGEQRGSVYAFNAAITTHPSFVLRSGGKRSPSYDELVTDIKRAHRLATQ